jgi:hypothetical protein
MDALGIIYKNGRQEFSLLLAAASFAKGGKPMATSE